MIPGGGSLHPSSLFSRRRSSCCRDGEFNWHSMKQGIGVAEMAVQSTAMEAAGPYDRAKALNAFKFGDVAFYWITRVSAISVLLILGGIILSLIAGAWPAMKTYG